jgi:hypothetical protein
MWLSAIDSEAWIPGTLRPFGAAGPRMTTVENCPTNRQPEFPLHTMVDPQTIKTASGEELVVLARADYEALLEAAEDAADVAIYDARKAELASAEPPPSNVSLAIIRGDSRLRAIRKWRGLTQIGLAEKAGITQRFYVRSRKPQANRLRRNGGQAGDCSRRSRRMDRRIIMKISVQVRDDQLSALDALAQKEDRSRAALIRDAVDDYLAKTQPLRKAFGLWRDRKIDGLEYQRKLRDEW